MASPDGRTGPRLLTRSPRDTGTGQGNEEETTGGSARPHSMLTV